MAPPNAFTDAETGGRVYIHPITGESFVSYTTVLSVLDKGVLPYWYGKQSARHAVERLTDMVKAVARPFCEDGACAECLRCVMRDIAAAGERERDVAADRGTRFHNVAEQYALTGQWIEFDDDIAPNVEQFRRFIEIHRVEFHAAEVTSINRLDGVAGTLDVVLTCGWMPPKHRDLIGVPVYGDYKTGSVHEIAGLQLAACRNGEAVLLPDGREAPMPGAHTETALSIQIKKDDFYVRPCPVGKDAYQKFLRALALWRDINEPDLELVGRAMYKPRAKKEA